MLQVVQPRKFRVDLLVGADLLVGRQPHFLAIPVARECAPRSVRAIVETHGRAAHVGQPADVFPGRKPPRDLQHRDLSHAVDEQIGGAVEQDRAANSVAPVIVVREAPKRRLNAADHDGHVGKELLQPASVDGRRVVGSASGRGVRRVGVTRAPLPCGRVVVDHRIHVAAGHAEEEAGPAARGEVVREARFVPPRLRNDSHAKTARGEHPGNERHTESRVIDVRVAVHQDDVELVPSAGVRLVERRRHKRPGVGPLRPVEAARSADVDKLRHAVGGIPSRWTDVGGHDLVGVPSGVTAGWMCVNPAGAAADRFLRRRASLCYRPRTGAPPSMSDVRAEPRGVPDAATREKTTPQEDPLAGDWSDGLPGPVR